MRPRIRRCVECPKCHTRYLIASSPYANGAFLTCSVVGSSEEYVLFCPCGSPPKVSWWGQGELKQYAISPRAHDRGYGSSDEIVSLGHELINNVN
jgi:hypothetical protein